MESPSSEHDVALDDTSLLDRFPYVSRLGSNDVPSDIEVEEIKAFLSEPTAQVQQMEAEISALQARLDCLRAKYTALKTKVDTCRSLITIPRRLPEDILLEIFLHCLPDDHNPTMSSRASPLLLTAVCRRWRILAHQTPKLWSTIHIPIEDLHDEWLTEEERDDIRKRTHQPIYTHLSQWLSRSGTRPLTLSMFINWDNDAGGPLKTISADYFQQLIPFVDRWKSVFFEGGVHSLSTLLTLPSSDFRSLISLFLELGQEDLPEDIPIFNAPCLRKVSIHKASLEPSTLDLPWAKLTHLDLGTAINSIMAPSVTQLSIVLSICKSLIYCGVDIDFGVFVQPMSFPKLQRISIRQPRHSANSMVSPHFCQMIQAPSLEYISLRGFTGAGFLALLSSKNGRHVKSLNIDARYIDLASLGEGLRRCPNLLSLSITHLSSFENGLKIDDDFFSLFIPKGRGWTGDQTSPCCPRLVELIFDDIICETLTGLIAFLTARQDTADGHSHSKLAILAPCSIREGSRLMDEAMIKHALKPFTDTGLRLQMFESLHQRTKNSVYWPYGSSRFQYADCWRD